MELPQAGTHLDHFMKQTRVHHVQLSAMADRKANMLLTLSALVITFSIGYLTDPVLKWPVLTLILFCLGTVITAAYAVLPKLKLDQYPDLENPDCNVLFFGNFMNLEYEEYSDMMERIMLDYNKVYEAQVREVYELGVFLGHKKYRYIRLAFILFIAGLIVSGLVFAIVEMMILTG